ncbi:S8 family peptidase [Ralstonia solanacearum]|uniref:S8 family peptidase n=1 Tax=Ralstonia solanacearum TaxID=305 RepID=UPI0013C3519F|nr:S8 family serine peptidase [Ralstonia solanacearum]
MSAIPFARATKFGSPGYDASVVLLLKRVDYVQMADYLPRQRQGIETGQTHGASFSRSAEMSLHFVNRQKSNGLQTVFLARALRRKGGQAMMRLLRLPWTTLATASLVLASCTANPTSAGADEGGDSGKAKGKSSHFCVDDALVAQQQTLPGLDGGGGRQVAIVVDPQGLQDEFVVNEVTYHPTSQADLQGFLTRYKGKVLRDGTPMIVPNNPRGTTSAASSGYYLIRVDLTLSKLADLKKTMEAHGLMGDFRFSSTDAARLLALVGRETNAGPNFVAKPLAAKIPEHPDGKGGNLDATQFFWLNGTLPLGTDVIRAWNYLLYKGFPPMNGTWKPSFVAILDGGFALNPADPTTSAPLTGNLDFGFFRQWDVVDHDLTAGATCPGDGDSVCSSYHGTQVFAVAAAQFGNSYGTAGTGGEVVSPMLIRIDGSEYVFGDAIRSASLNGADVINLSWGGKCGSVCDAFHETLTALQEDITFATGYGPSAVVVAAGNDGLDAADPFTGDLPCHLDNVICVGAVQQNANAEPFSNFGTPLTIWAPDREIGTVDPILAGNLLGPAQLRQPLKGTSFAAPFVSGVIGLIKQLGNRTTNDLKNLLQVTSNVSSDPKVSPVTLPKTQGIVNPLGAVMTARPPLRPTIQITNPANGAQVVPDASLQFVASVNDPEPGFANYPYRFPVTVRWSSNRDGLLCSGAVPGVPNGATCTPSKLTPGTHVITAVAISAFGAQSIPYGEIVVEVVYPAPIPVITLPAPNSTFFTSQTITFHGHANAAVDGLLSGSALTWSSSFQGDLGPSVCTSPAVDCTMSAKLIAGTHVITLKATNSVNVSGTATVPVQVLSGDDYPTVTILSYYDGDYNFAPGDVETLVGAATDPVDATLPDSAFVWTDSRDGFLGARKTLPVVLSGTPGVFTDHLVTLTVTNHAGHKGTASVHLGVGTIN